MKICICIVPDFFSNEEIFNAKRKIYKNKKYLIWGLNSLISHFKFIIIFPFSVA